MSSNNRYLVGGTIVIIASTFLGYSFFSDGQVSSDQAGMVAPLSEPRSKTEVKQEANLVALPKVNNNQPGDPSKVVEAMNASYKTLQEPVGKIKQEAANEVQQQEDYSTDMGSFDESQVSNQKSADHWDLLRYSQDEDFEFYQLSQGVLTKANLPVIDGPDNGCSVEICSFEFSFDGDVFEILEFSDDAMKKLNFGDVTVLKLRDGRVRMFALR